MLVTFRSLTTTPDTVVSDVLETTKSYGTVSPTA